MSKSCWIVLVGLLVLASGAGGQGVFIRVGGGVVTAVAQTPATSPAPATQPATMPADDFAQLSPADQELVRVLKQEVEQQVEQLRSMKLRQREQAQQTLVDLHRRLLLPLEAAQGKSIPATEYNRLLSDWSTEVTLTRFARELSVDDTIKLRKLRREKPEIFSLLLTDDTSRQLLGISALHGWNDPQQLAEPLVARMLRAAAPEHIQQLLSLMNSGRYNSPVMLQSLLDLYEGRMQRPASLNTPMAHMLHPANLRPQLLPIIAKYDDKRVPPVLLAGLLESRWIYQATFVIDGLERSKAYGAVGHIIDNIREEPSQTLGQINNVNLTFCASDTLVYAALKLTGQSPDTYGLKVQSYGGRVGQIGFVSDDARKEAIKKLRAWWEANRDKPPYRNSPKVTPAVSPANVLQNNIQPVMF